MYGTLSVQQQVAVLGQVLPDFESHVMVAGGVGPGPGGGVGPGVGGAPFFTTGKLGTMARPHKPAGGWFMAMRMKPCSPHTSPHEFFTIQYSCPVSASVS